MIMITTTIKNKDKANHNNSSVHPVSPIATPPPATSNDHRSPLSLHILPLPPLIMDHGLSSIASILIVTLASWSLSSNFNNNNAKHVIHCIRHSPSFLSSTTLHRRSLLSHRRTPSWKNYDGASNSKINATTIII